MEERRSMERGSFPTSDPRWDLESIFPGGVRSQAFEAFVKALEADVGALAAEADGLSHEDLESETGLRAWWAFIERWEDAAGRLQEAGAFARATAATHTDDPQALGMPGRLTNVVTALDALEVMVRDDLASAGEQGFEALVAEEGLGRMRLFLEEMREEGQRAMGTDLERLAVSLNRDGLHAWGELYNRVSSTLAVELAREEGLVEQVSVGQAKNLLSHAERGRRRQAFEGLDRAWRSRSTTFAAALSAIIGAEQTLYDRRGGDELTVPLFRNRVERETVEAMMIAADEFQDGLARYRRAKARVLGVDRLAWYDLQAPVGEDAGSELAYEAAQGFIVEQVEAFHEPMGRFYKDALARQWVEAEDRSGKSQGGYCTSFPVTGEMRIFMTYGGTTSSAQTLAHELGHAYHGWLMAQMGLFERKVPMGLAETASTLAEMLVEEAAIAQAGPEARLRLLDERLQRADSFLVNIPARYRLERRMHAARRQGQLDVEGLNEMTREVFEAHYGESLSGVDELFWASKLHFYITRLPFYNFPYTFGYLFSRAVGKRAEQEGPALVDALLRDTGRLSAEEIGERYLDADLGQVEFWRDAAASTRGDIEEFVSMVESRGN